MRFDTWQDLADKIEDINPGFSGSEWIQDIQSMYSEQNWPEPSMEEVWLTFLENRLDRQADGMDIGTYLLQYTTHSEDMEAMVYRELQYAIIETLRLASVHAHDGDLNITVTYSDYPTGNLTHVYQYTHNWKFVFNQNPIMFEY